ncbi:MAG TPA: DUF4089 domain-containing protein [Xanthobacteraceae bacterium]|jgi:hypothetical protein|nr:DUF4089 domain-containing protein [Xanthobacteraceae bacterium]
MKRQGSRKPKPAQVKRRAKKARIAKAGTTAAAPQHDAIASLVAASAQALGLTLDPAWHDGVAFNLRLILQLGARVDEFTLPDETEPAPVFHA